MSSPNSKARHWSATSTAEKKKLAPNSPTWRRLAGCALLPSVRKRLKNKLFFPCDESDSDSELTTESPSDGEDDVLTSSSSSNKRPRLLVGDGSDIHKRAIFETAALKDIFERNAACRICKGPVTVEFPSCCLATWTKVACQKNDCSFVDYGRKPQPADVPALPTQGSVLIERTSDYALNVQYVLGFMGCGDGGREAACILGFVGLPNSTTMETRTFQIIEQRIGPVIRQLTHDIMRENLIDEVEQALKKADNFDLNVFNLWKQSIDPDSDVVLAPAMYPTLMVSADFAWQTRGGGNAYNSNSGYGVLVGSEGRKPLVMSIKSKFCRICMVHGEENAPADHVCMKNHQGSSKAMEPQGILEQYMEMYDKFNSKISHMVTDDDSTIKSKLKYTNAAWMVVNNSDKESRITMKNGKTKK